MTKNLQTLPDTNQNFWQLASIQIMTYGLPGMFVGIRIAKDTGIWSACFSILIGNLLLWIIGISMVFMSSQGRNNAIQNIGNYFGIAGTVLANIVLGAVFLIWYPINIEYAVSVLDTIIPNHFLVFKYLGIALGILIALMSAGGILLIRKVCVSALLAVLCLFFISFFIFESNLNFGEFDFSILGILSVVLVVFSGMINLPTFFRHSRSKVDSVFALTLITIFISLIQFLGIISGLFSQLSMSDNSFVSDEMGVLLAVVFVVVTSVCVNLGNIYFSSAILEFFAPKVKKTTGYIFIGFCGSLLYVLYGFSNVFDFVENIVEGFIINLSIVLMMSFLGVLLSKHESKSIEKFSNSISWILGCIVTFYVATHSIMNPHVGLLSGLVTSILCFMFAFFASKTISSIKVLHS